MIIEQFAFWAISFTLSQTSWKLLPSLRFIEDMKWKCFSSEKEEKNKSLVIFEKSNKSNNLIGF